MKMICSPSYQHSSFMANEGLGHVLPQCMSCHKSTVVTTGTAHCFHDS